MNTIHFTCTTLQGANKKGIIPVDESGYYDMVIGGLNIYNSAGEYYEYQGAKELFEGSSSFMRRIKRGVLRGEVGHPRQLPGMSNEQYIARIYDIYEPNICVHYKDIYLDFDNFKDEQGNRIVAIRAKLKPSGANANFLQKALDNPHENVCFSIRSFTENIYVRGRVNKTLKTIVTFDYVNEPGIHIAEKYKSPTLESLTDQIFTQKQFDRMYDNKNTIGVSLGQESALMTRDELYKSLGWVDTTQSRFMRW